MVARNCMVFSKIKGTWEFRARQLSIDVRRLRRRTAKVLSAHLSSYGADRGVSDRMCKVAPQTPLPFDPVDIGSPCLQLTRL